MKNKSGNRKLTHNSFINIGTDINNANKIQ